MKHLSLTLALLLAVAPNCLAESRKTEAAKDWIDQWKNATGRLIDMAEAMPADRYDYRPVEEIDTFADQVKHVCVAMRILLANAEGKHVPLEEASLDRLKTKDEILAELRRMADAGAAVIGRIAGRKSDGDVVESQFFGRTTRRFLIIQAIAHDSSHYGQMVMYLRLNGITPPASR